MFPPTQNRPPALETRAIVTDERTAEYGRLILDSIKRIYAQPEEKKQFRKLVERYTSLYLQKRLSERQLGYIREKFSQGQSSVFDQIIAEVIKSLKDEGSLKVDANKKESYLEISDAYAEPSFWKEETIGDEKIQIRNKEYFTFVPTSIDPSKIILEASKFYEALILAYDKLQSLARTNDWNFSMKLKTDFLELVNDLDSAVFYVSDERAGDTVRKIVTEEMEKMGLMIDRFGRSEAGFDIKFLDGRILTHDQLISMAVSKVIDDDYHGERKMVEMSPVEFGKSIRQKVEKAGNLTPSQMIQVI